MQKMGSSKSRSRSRSRERKSGRRRSRSRSPRRRDSRSRRSDRHYRRTDDRRRRSRSRSSGNEVEKLLKKEREKSRKDRGARESSSAGMASSSVAIGSSTNADGGSPFNNANYLNSIDLPSTSATTANLAASGTLPTNLSSADMLSNKDICKYIKERVELEVNSKHKSIEDEIQRRVAKARLEMETSIRAQVEMQCREEMLGCQKREMDAKHKCEQLEKELRQKLEQIEEQRKKLDEERLEMLEIKRKLEEEKNSMKKEREKLTRKEQTVILGKGGARPKLQFSFNSSK